MVCKTERQAADAVAVPVDGVYEHIRSAPSAGVDGTGWREGRQRAWLWATVTVGLDGTCMLMGERGWWEAMVGTFGFYNKAGDRLHTVYTAATPEYGKLTFFERFDRELDRVKAAHPGALYVGVADGAKDNWLYLDAVTEKQVVDFFHATQYLWKAAEPLFAADGAGLRPWVDSSCHRLKQARE